MDGGILFSSGSLADIINCTIRNNMANDRGGVICTYSFTFTLHGTETATGNSKFNIIDTNFTNNSANYHSGGVIAILDTFETWNSTSGEVQYNKSATVDYSTVNIMHQ